MKSKIKGFLAGVAATVLLSASVALAAPIEVEFNAINVIVNGKRVQADNISYNDTTYVPLRVLAEMLDKKVAWDEATNSAIITDKNTVQIIYDRNNPAPVDVMQTITVESNSGDYTAEVAVKEIVRGSAAWDILKKNRLNTLPGDGEYLIAKIYIKISSADTNKQIDIKDSDFKLYDKDNKLYSNATGVVGPEPSLNTSLNAGDSHEGYAVFKVKTLDTNPKMVYGAKNDGTGGMWFELK